MSKVPSPACDSPASERLVPSPVGLLRVSVSDTALTGVWLNARGAPDHSTPQALMAEVIAQLSAYFAGTLHTFSLPLHLDGTPFQRDVWTALQDVPYGATCSYAELAERIGKPDAVRAVGAANGQNPIPIVIPCHRVIGKDGSLTGFGGGLKMKAWLLAHESGQPRLDF